MNFYENMRNKRKKVEKNKEGTEKTNRVVGTYNITYMSAILDYQTCYQIKSETLHFNSIV